MPHTAEASGQQISRRGRTSLLSWSPLLVIGAGLAFGLVLWARWGFLIAFETIRSYCF